MEVKLSLLDSKPIKGKCGNKYLTLNLIFSNMMQTGDVVPNARTQHFLPNIYLSTKPEMPSATEE